MTQSIRDGAYPALPAGQELTPADNHGEHHVNPLHRAHRLLRGRYLWAIALGAIGLFGSAALAWKSTPLQYTSIGRIDVEPQLPAVLVRTDEQSVGPMFEHFVNREVGLIQGERNLNMARGSDLWRSTGRDYSPREFSSRLTVRHPVRSREILVMFTDEDRAVARIAVEAIIRAYMQLRPEFDVQADSRRLDVLNERLVSKRSQFRQLTQQIRDISESYGTDELGPLLNAKIQQIEAIKDDLRRIEIALTTLHGRGDAAARNTQDEAADLSAVEIAAADPTMRNYLDQRRNQESYIQVLSAKLGLNHRLVVDERHKLQAIDAIIERYAREYNENRRGTRTTGITAAPTDRFELMSQPQLLARRAERQQLLEVLDLERHELAEKHRRIVELQEELDTVSYDLQQTRQRLDVLQLESRVYGRVMPMSYGEQPLYPSNAGKRKQLAVVSGMAGGSLGVGLIMLVGLIDRRLRTSDDAAYTTRQRIRMLGILPALPENMTDPEQITIAAFGVHHIRTMLQLSGDGDNNRVFAVTSPAPGTGKTSLTFALGLSFAHCGMRTLLIDGDIVGAGLTTRSEARIHPRLGQILLRQGTISAAQLNQALELAERNGRKLGETLVAMGLLRREQVDEGLSGQRRTLLGLLDVLAGQAELDQCVMSIGLPDLDILPVGAAQAHQAATLSPKTVQTLIEQAKRSYDIVLFDTGPILGSLEASLISAHVDGVVLTVSRGEQRPMAERAADHLWSIGARLSGLVFNRADGQDVTRSSYGSMQSQRMGDSLPATALKTAAAPSSATRLLGPIATAVACQVESENGNGGDRAGGHGDQA
jgi:polysaccharide biosynthesis transport protein